MALNSKIVALHFHPCRNCWTVQNFQPPRCCPAITFGCPKHDARSVGCAHLQARWPPTRIPCDMFTAPLRLQMVSCTLMAMTLLLADVHFLPQTKISNFIVYWIEHIYVYATLHTAYCPLYHKYTPHGSMAKCRPKDRSYRWLRPNF